MTLKIEPGKIFGFLGPNGAGKSTTIKMLTGLLTPEEGDILLSNIDIRKNPIQAKRIIGYVPDEPVFYDRMSGAGFLSFIADIFKMDAATRKAAADIAEEFGIADKLGDTISSYSHGMKQKLSITAALMHNPEIFILDEPITGLDPQSAFTLKTKMRQLCSQGKTVFFSTHVMEVAEKVCDKVGIINKGRIIACGDLNEIKVGQNADSKDSLESIFLELTNEHTDIN
jgi:ABC-2 type transport system ATP-binding protein